jgi:hypothetical protein
VRGNGGALFPFIEKTEGIPNRRRTRKLRKVFGWFSFVSTHHFISPKVARSVWYASLSAVGRAQASQMTRHRRARRSSGVIFPYGETSRNKEERDGSRAHPLPMWAAFIYWAPLCSRRAVYDDHDDDAAGE